MNHHTLHLFNSVIELENEIPQDLSLTKVGDEGEKEKKEEKEEKKEEKEEKKEEKEEEKEEDTFNDNPYISVFCPLTKSFISVKSKKFPKDQRSASAILIEDYAVVMRPKAQYAAEDILSYVKSTRINHKNVNATVYACWETVMSKTRFELLVDQILHYVSPIFTGEFYLPGESEREEPLGKFPIFVIGTLTEEEAVSKACQLLKSGVALSSSTITHAVKLIQGLNGHIDIADVSNKEAKMLLMKEKKYFNVPPEEFVRFLVYVSTGTTMLIKSKDLIRSLKGSAVEITTYVRQYPHLSKLASVFNRFKPLFLAMKKGDKNNAKMINLLGRLSKQAHIPMPVNPLNCVTWRVLDSSELHWVNNATNAALLRVLKCSKLYSIPYENHTYLIHNGTSWACTKPETKGHTNAARVNFEILLENYKARLGDRFCGKKIFIPEDVEYGLPISEKQMVGHIPLGTKISSKDNIALGAFYRDGYNANIVDLSAITPNGDKVGWNAVYNHQDMVYSGDKIYPDQIGAVQYILFHNKEDTPDSEVLLTVNNWQGVAAGWKYDIVLGRGNNPEAKYIMDPAKVDFTLNYTSPRRENFIGLVRRLNGTVTFYFCLLPSSNRSTSAANELTGYSIKGISHAMDHDLTLNELLFEHLGAERVTTSEEAEIDLSLNKISRDFFNLFE